VGDIWSGIKKHLISKGVSFDFVLFTNYEAQVRSLLNSHIDVAWNGPIAHVMLEELVRPNQTVLSLGMRDVDRDCQSVIIVRKDSGIQTLQDLHERNILTGTSDSPQAHVIPIHYIQSQMITPKSIQSLDFDVGKHGDTALGEIRALEMLASNAADAEAAIVSKMMWERAAQGSIPSIDATLLQTNCEELVNANLPPFDHCQFDSVLESGDTEKEQRLHQFGKQLLSMDWNEPEQQKLMKLEGIRKQWVKPRQAGYNIVRSALLGSKLHNHRPAIDIQYRSFSTSSDGYQPNRKIAVVGAGVAGLQAIRALKVRGFDVKAFEASQTMGGLWNANYANFGVQVPKELCEFQDFPMNLPRGEYASGPQVQQYVEEYTDAFGLRDSIQFNTTVTSVVQDRDSEDKKWTITSKKKDGKRQTEIFDYLVVSTGLYSNRNKCIPTFSGQENFSGQIMHSCDFHDANIAKSKRVLVVGSGKSAVDCAIEASKAGASSVTLLQRTAHWPTPRKIAGLIPFQYIFLSRLGTALVSVHRDTFPGGSGTVVNGFRNSILGPMIMRPVFGIVEELFAFQFNLRGNLRPRDDVVSDFYNVALVFDSELKELRNASKVVVKMGEIQEIERDGTTVKLKDASKLQADFIVFSTGFTQDFSMFDSSTIRDLDLQEDGMYLYRYILPEKVPNLAFIGHAATISNFSSYGLQAEWLSRNLTGCLVSGGTASSSPETVHAEIQARKQ
jgi:dimethylaniline monooxygenase (N-oxide forming)